MHFVEHFDCESYCDFDDDDLENKRETIAVVHVLEHVQVMVHLDANEKWRKVHVPILDLEANHHH